MTARRWLGLVLVCYSVIPLVNATVPAAARVTGERLVVSHDYDSYECMVEIGAPPLAGLYGSCGATGLPEEGDARSITLHGPGVVAEWLRPGDRRDAWGWGGQAYVWPGGAATAVAATGAVVFVGGFALLLGGFRRTTRKETAVTTLEPETESRT
ncbi:MAG: hypothetical protein HOV79_06010 [Hamadaea sp.]|nr:hypothetical protein [Hamadaea sp.]